MGEVIDFSKRSRLDDEPFNGFGPRESLLAYNKAVKSERYLAAALIKHLTVIDAQSEKDRLSVMDSVFERLDEAVDIMRHNVAPGYAPCYFNIICLADIVGARLGRSGAAATLQNAHINGKPLDINLDRNLLIVNSKHRQFPQLGARPKMGDVYFYFSHTEDEFQYLAPGLRVEESADDTKRKVSFYDYGDTLHPLFEAVQDLTTNLGEGTDTSKLALRLPENRILSPGEFVVPVEVWSRADPGLQ